MAKNPSPTAESVVYMDHVPFETIGELLLRLKITPEETGEIFVNHHLASLDTIIPHSGSRIAIFSRGMNLIDGGQHLKGHGLITSSRKKTNYY